MSIDQTGESLTKDDVLAFMQLRDVCDDALCWVEGTPGTPEDLWAVCPEMEWMTWILREAGIDYETQEAPLRADYFTGVEPFWIDCQAKRAPIWVTDDLVLANFRAKEALLMAEYRTKLVGMFPWSVVEAALKENR